MKKTCTYCGAYIDDNAKLCTNCGKIVKRPKEQTFSAAVDYDKVVKELTPKREGKQMRAARSVPRASMKSADEGYAQHKKQENVAHRSYSNSPVSPRQRAQAEKLRYTDSGTSGKENVSRVAPVLKVIVKIALIIIAACFIFAFIRIFTISHGSYDFKNGMAMTNENYYEATSNYFEDGKWRFRLFKNQVYYKGTMKDGDEYLMTFKYRSGEVIVDSLYVNDKEIPQKDIMDNYIMGMFMSEKIK